MADELAHLLRYFKPHPWHGISPGRTAPAEVNAYVELVPTDAVKYEIDKETGHLKLDRPQLFSSLCPSPYGFIPRTYCGERVGRYTSERIGRDVMGDGDPMDICVLTEKPITHGDILVRAIPIGGLRMVDKEEADDKIVAVLAGDQIFGHIADITDLRQELVDRLVHYFLTYKDLPGAKRPRTVGVDAVYGRSEATRVIQLSIEDYLDRYGPLPAERGPP